MDQKKDPICSMAQIYPEDRGTNYAIREGSIMGKKVGGATEKGNLN